MNQWIPILLILGAMSLLDPVIFGLAALGACAGYYVACKIGERRDRQRANDEALRQSNVVPLRRVK